METPPKSGLPPGRSSAFFSLSHAIIRRSKRAARSHGCLANRTNRSAARCSNCGSAFCRICTRSSRNVTAPARRSCARCSGPIRTIRRPTRWTMSFCAVPLWPEMNYVGQQEADPLTFVLYPHEGRGSATFYEDAGDGYEYLNGFYARRAISCEVASGKIRVVVGEQEGEFAPARRQVRLAAGEIASEPGAGQLE